MRKHDAKCVRCGIVVRKILPQKESHRMHIMQGKIEIHKKISRFLA
jgi:hypothetical protein